MRRQHSIQILFSCTYFMYSLSQNSTAIAEIDSADEHQFDAIISSKSSVDDFPDTFYNRSYTLDDEEIVFRVVNGKPAKLGEVPYQVGVMMALRKIYIAICGGSIIGPSKVLSAAHCFCAAKFSNCLYKGKMARGEYKNKLIMAGNLNSIRKFRHADSLEDGQWRSITHGIYPMAYVPQFLLKSDAAVLYMNKPFTFNAHVSPIKYASVEKDYSGNCLASGYGRLSKTVESKILNTAWLPILPKKTCEKISKQLGIILESNKFVCTSGSVSSVHQGDSGGPLICKNTGDPQDDGKGVLVGIACAIVITDDVNIALFTRVTTYSYLINGRCTFLLSSFNILILNCLINFTVSLF